MRRATCPAMERRANNHPVGPLTRVALVQASRERRRRAARALEELSQALRRVAEGEPPSAEELLAADERCAAEGPVTVRSVRPRGVVG